MAPHQLTSLKFTDENGCDSGRVDANGCDESCIQSRERCAMSANARLIAERRYFVRDNDGRPHETPSLMMWRVASALAAVETRYGAGSDAVAAYRDTLYRALAHLDFLPAGRTLANAGAPTALVPNCIVLHIQDSMDAIFSTLRDAALLQQRGSGLGFPLHLLRPANAPTFTSQGTSSGPVSFLHVYNGAFSVIKQQQRHGANMAICRVDHPDILEFASAKRREGTLVNFNISVGLTHEFLRQVRARAEEPWMCHFGGRQMLPRRIERDANFNITRITEVSMPAYQVFREIVELAWSNGEPGIVNLDAANDANPLPGLGRIEATNPCGKCPCILFLNVSRVRRRAILARLGRVQPRGHQLGQLCPGHSRSPARYGAAARRGAVALHRAHRCARTRQCH